MERVHWIHIPPSLFISEWQAASWQQIENKPDSLCQVLLLELFLVAGAWDRKRTQSWMSGPKLDEWFSSYGIRSALQRFGDVQENNSLDKLLGVLFEVILAWFVLSWVDVHSISFHQNVPWRDCWRDGPCSCITHQPHAVVLDLPQTEPLSILCPPPQKTGPSPKLTLGPVTSCFGNLSNIICVGS